MGRWGNRTYGTERKGTKLYILAQQGLATRCETCGADFIKADVATKLVPITIDPKHCSQFCYDMQGVFDGE